LSGTASQIYHLARRSVVRQARQPANVVAPIIFPLALLAVNAGGLQSATTIPGFPTDRFVAFALAIPFMQGALFASINAGSSLARDVSTGFLQRLALTPMVRTALLLGALGGVMAVALLGALVYLVFGFAAGLGVKAGVGGVLVIVALGLLIALGFAGLGAFIGLRTGSAEAVQGVFPMFFVFLFLSSVNLPRELISVDWFRTVATYNPVSYLVEGVRAPIIFGWDAEALALGFGFAILLAAITVALSARALRTQLVRT
jgi:ABC-2 type transport system permease protein